jgi:hypothetical protein
MGCMCYPASATLKVVKREIPYTCTLGKTKLCKLTAYSTLGLFRLLHSRLARVELRLVHGNQLGQWLPKGL